MAAQGPLEGQPPSGSWAPSCNYGESAGHRLASMTHPQPRGCRTLLVFSLRDLGSTQLSAAHPNLSKNRLHVCLRLFTNPVRSVNLGGHPPPHLL